MSGTIRDESGTLILLDSAFHVTLPPGPVVALKGFFDDNFSLQCLGNPS